MAPNINKAIKFHYHYCVSQSFFVRSMFFVFSNYLFVCMGVRFIFITNLKRTKKRIEKLGVRSSMCSQFTVHTTHLCLRTLINMMKTTSMIVHIDADTRTCASHRRTPFHRLTASSNRYRGPGHLYARTRKLNAFIVFNLFQFSSLFTYPLSLSLQKTTGSHGVAVCSCSG